MGVRGLGKLIKDYGKIITLSNYKDKKLAIDTSIFLHKFMFNSSNRSVFLNRFKSQINSFEHNNIEVIYIFEGQYPIEKQQVINNRKLKKNENSIKITQGDIEALKILLNETGIQYIESHTEGEKHCAYLNKIKEVDAVLSNDYDTLVFGCDVLLTYMNGKYIEFKLDNILNNLEIEYSLFIDICIAAGCDYYPSGIKNYGTLKSLKMVKKYGTIENWDNIIVPEDLNLQKYRKIFIEF